MGTTIPLSKGRRALAAMLEYSRTIPTIPVNRPMNLADLVHARRRCVESISWTAIFIRAYGIVCARFPELRRSWISWPTPRLYEHPYSQCAVAVERDVDGEKVVLMSLIRAPESKTLSEIHNHLHHFQTAPLQSVSTFRASLRLGALPAWLQRIVLWSKLDISGKRRVQYFGTFGISNYGKLGAESMHPIGPQTTVITLSPIQPNGDVNVKLIYDHRVLDGGFIARVLAHLDEVLHDVILAELTQDARQAA
jgi:pyruvate/2-oxoglutarate dehydrogenase complex dihydrolipoamide acyltransferase (E2) component